MLLILYKLHVSIFSPHLQRSQEVASLKTRSLLCSVRSRIRDEHLWLFGSEDERKVTPSDSFSHSEESVQVFTWQKEMEEEAAGEEAAISAGPARTQAEKES